MMPFKMADKTSYISWYRNGYEKRYACLDHHRQQMILGRSSLPGLL